MPAPFYAHRFVLVVCTMASCHLVSGQFRAPSPASNLPRAQTVSPSSQSGTVTPAQASVDSGQERNSLNPTVQIQGSYQGGVPDGQLTRQQLQLTFEDAIRRGILHNLGAITAGEASRQARAQKLSALAQMLPDITGGVRESVEQINLAAQGLRISVPIPGFHFPPVVGPFNNFDARAYLTQSLSVTGVRNFQSSQEYAKSAEFSAKESRELVALAVSGTCLQLLASTARIEASKAQIETARAVHEQAVDRNRSGLNARIDVNRSLVELQTQQQRLTTLVNDYEKRKLALARMIGLPMAQPFALSNTITHRESSSPDMAGVILQALSNRSDVLAAGAQVKAAELTLKAATSEYYPSLAVTADYGATGINPSQAHGTFSISGGVQFPIFRSGRIRADIEDAGAALAQRKAEYEDIRVQVEQDVRNALLDFTAAAEQVRVAASNRALASETLQQARDRFRAGVADTVEVVQAQESVATAEQDDISALYAFNLVQITLGWVVGQTEQAVARLLEGK